MKEIEISKPLLTESERTLSYSARISLPWSRPFDLWFTFPRNYASYVTRTADSFLLACFYLGMNLKIPIRVHGAISEGLLENLSKFQKLWQQWCPGRYEEVEIFAVQVVKAQGARKSKAIIAFSGGVDSSFSAFYHKKIAAEPERIDIEAALMVHGFDIPLGDTEAFDRAFHKAKQSLNSLGVEAIPLVTNLRQLPMLWVDIFAAATASCLSVFGGQFSQGVIASSMLENVETLPYGSSQYADPLLSSKEFSIIHDGVKFDRVEKLKYLAQWPEGIRNLRVCYQGPVRDKNCGYCEKCIRTILCLKVLDIQIPCFGNWDIPSEVIKKLKPRKTVVRSVYTTVLNIADKKGIREPWVEAVRTLVYRRAHIERHPLTRFTPEIKLFLKKLYLQLIVPCL